MITKTGFFATGTHPSVQNINDVEIYFGSGFYDDKLTAYVNQEPIDSISAGWDTPAVEDVHPTVLALPVTKGDAGETVATHVYETRNTIALRKAAYNAQLNTMIFNPVPHE